MLNLTPHKPRIPIVSILIMVTILIVGGIGIFSYNNSYGAAPSGWSAGRIIDDSVFTNKNSMSAAQIQSFLNSKVPTCDTNGTQTSEYGGPDLNGDGRVQRWEWGKSKYNQTTFPCLKDYVQDGKKASQIIYEASQEFSINPQVLLVLLQKEQSLVTDTWPLNLQYRSATGYGCPDTAACDSKYYGLTNQVRWAATMFRAIMNASPTWYTPYVLGNNYIQYNPSSSCGGSTVNIQNRATQALYNYTPYQPNKGALDAGWGQASCGAYGNRNFFLYFSNWFGRPNADATYGYSVVSQEAYSDTNYQTKITSSPITVEPGSDVYLKTVIKNTGNQVWYRDFLNMGTKDPQDRSSIFSNKTWIGANRPTKVTESSIPAGGTATFTFKATAPNDLGTYSESFGLVIEGQRWLSGSFTYDIKVASSEPYYSVDTVSLDAYSDQAGTNRLGLSRISMYYGDKIYIKAKLKNTGNRDLPANTTKLATQNPIDRVSVFRDNSWISGSRVASAKEGLIKPGSIGTYEFSLTAPSVAGVYSEEFGVLIENQRWLSYVTDSINITVKERPLDTLDSNTSLLTNGSLLSGNSKYRIVVQGDGNLVIYSPHRAIWASGTNGKGSARLVMQNDGNLVIYKNGGGAIWASGTNGKGSARLVMQNDGNLVIYKNGGGAIWASGTNGKE